MLLDLFFPRRCVGCKREGSWLCHVCAETLVIPDWPKEVLPGVTAHFPFQHPIVREALHHLKYHGVDELAALLVQRMRVALDPDTVLVPVPISYARLKTRGFNQAERIARAMANGRGIEVLDDLLVKRKRNSQVGLSREERRLNAESAFELHKGVIIPGRIVLIDDTCTTGATLDSCRKVLGRDAPAVVVAYEELKEKDHL
jgi:ComF family protein